MPAIRSNATPTEVRIGYLLDEQEEMCLLPTSAWSQGDFHRYAALETRIRQLKEGDR